MLVMLEGEVEFMLNGAATRIGPGSVAYAASNDLHGPRNPTDKPCRYLIVTVGRG
jgi:quercetin dioxygenase-like cupin family protein